ncbi:MAG: aminodeoxychorismate/anthranilate synthase component II [Phycisphaeraceae bacterium]|nr:aminodeoxychorismate/anthranilate synthase component II [Phycisphaeraceae bacterium]
MILLIDNYDSFTWNLVQRLGEIEPAIVLGRDLVVARNDKITPDQADALDHGRGPDRLIISPGPGSPDEAGVSAEMIRHYAGRIPILGVCLGHQCMGAMHGMAVVRHSLQMHGKTSLVYHDGRGVFRGLSNPFVATRYHSLIVRANDAPAPGWEVSAWTEDPTGPDGTPQRIVMGLRRVWGGEAPPLEGVQFHPESFLTDEGPTLLRNFLEA